MSLDTGRNLDTAKHNGRRDGGARLVAPLGSPTLGAPTLSQIQAASLPEVPNPERSTPETPRQEFQSPEIPSLAPAAPTLADGAHVGEALRLIRLHRNLTLEEVAETTRVRRAYLEAIETMRLDALPSRPFTIGYVRAYAQMLGVPSDTAVERFRADEPLREEPLRAPVGVGKTRDPRLALIIIGAGVVLTAIVAWNVAQRLVNPPVAPKSTAPAAAPPASTETRKDGPLALGAPLPAPVESTTPALYETPGLANAVPRANGTTTLDDVPTPVTPAVDPAANVRLAASFIPTGQVYGAAAAPNATVIVQALKPAPLVVKGLDGTVYFARQLAKGESYRAPPIPGVAVEASEPHAFQVFVGGQSRGLLPGVNTQLQALAGG